MSAPPQLRPMSVGDMLDAAIRLYRQHFLTFVGIVALLQVPMAVLQFLVQYYFGNAALTNWLRITSRPPIPGPGQSPLDIFPFGDLLMVAAISLVIGAVQFLIVRNLIAGALANAISRSYTGQPISILSAYSFGLRRFLSLIGASLVTFLIAVALSAVIVGCSVGSMAALFASSNRSAGAIAAVLVVLIMFGLFVLFSLAALFFYTRLLVTTQAVVLEGHGPLAGLARSWRLVAGSFWRTLGILVLVGLLAYMIAAVPATVVSFALTIASGNALANLVRNQIITTLLAQLGQIVVLPLQLAIYTLLYYDLRIRKEGYDIELMAQSQQATAS
jgi:hypothetical protein